MQKIFLFLVLIFFSSLVPSSAYAIYDPTSVSNNRFGIHIAGPNDLEDAAKLVNTNGDWGYVTFVITKTERDIARWQTVFNKARRLHLIPIVRIATRFDGTNWEKGNIDEIDGWVSFLNGLNWVIKNRYVVIGNEPNHSKEWGGEVNPEEYIVWLKAMSDKLKASSNDFFVLPAGFDASAPNSRGFKTTMEEKLFLTWMLKADPGVFNLIDGWTSHSYPNPAFVGSPNGYGRQSVQAYEWELLTLTELGINKKLPVFITETGWSHGADPSGVGKNFTEAFNGAWNSPKVVAVTPFILNYPDPPFEMFSWKKKEGTFYDFYYEIQKLKKLNGSPLQVSSGEIIATFVPPIVFSGSDFSGFIVAKNTGQTIWTREDLSLDLKNEEFSILSFSTEPVEPGETKIISFMGRANGIEGAHTGMTRLSFKNEPFGNSFEFRYFIPSPAQITNLNIFDKLRFYFDSFLINFTKT